MEKSGIVEMVGGEEAFFESVGDALREMEGVGRAERRPASV